MDAVKAAKRSALSGNRFKRLGTPEGSSCLGIDVGISIRSTPPGESLRVNFSPDHFHSAASHLFLSLFRADKPILICSGELVGIRKK